MKEAQASIPASLSFIFKPYQNKNPSRAGSTGVGCTIDRYVSVTIQKSSHFSLLFNGSLIHFPTGAYVARQLTHIPISVDVRSPLPLGYGFGISGAISLGIAYGLQKLFILQKSQEELIRIAHRAEICNHTGLGSVATEITGGFLLKTKPALPVEAFCFPFVGEKLYAILIDSFPTPSLLTDTKRMRRIQEEASHALFEIEKRKKTISLSQILDISYSFVQKSGILTDKRVVDLIEKLRKKGAHATMAILGNVVITNTNPSFVPLSGTSKGNYRIEEFSIM